MTTWEGPPPRQRAQGGRRDAFIAMAQVYAEEHQPDHKRGGCTCGFCLWSVEHVLIMAMREAWDHQPATQP